MQNKRGKNRSFSYNFFPKNRRGQFFLIAAVVIIVIIVSIVTVSNYTQKKEVTKLYDLGQELGIESQNVLDYGTYNAKSSEEIDNLMEQFIQNYHQYEEEDRNIYFVFGNKNKVSVVGYQDIEDESVCIKLNPTRTGSTPCQAYSTIGETQAFTPTTGEIGKVAIVIAENQYEFALKSGENFYFVIWQKIGEERHVVTSD
jgi:uncharacterized protein (UPF0333 family)